MFVLEDCLNLSSLIKVFIYCSIQDAFLRIVQMEQFTPIVTKIYKLYMGQTSYEITNSFVIAGSMGTKQ